MDTFTTLKNYTKKKKKTNPCLLYIKSLKKIIPNLRYFQQNIKNENAQFFD